MTPKIQRRTTLAERRQAAQHDKEQRKIEQIGVAAAAAFGAEARADAMNDPSHWQQAIQKVIDELTPILTTAQVVAHAKGNERTYKTASQAGKGVLSLSGSGIEVFDKMLNYFRKKSSITNDEIERLMQVYGTEATKVLGVFRSDAERKINTAMLKASEAGSHVSQGKEILGEAFDAIGISPANSFSLEAIFRTQTAIAYSAGRWQANQDKVIQEILWGYKYVTVGDSRVREEHAALDGTTLPKDDPFWQVNWPPNGWACRCTVLEIFEERETYRPPMEIEINGKMVRPGADEGFRFNAGKLFG